MCTMYADSGDVLDVQRPDLQPRPLGGRRGWIGDLVTTGQKEANQDWRRGGGGSSSSSSIVEEQGDDLPCGECGKVDVDMNVDVVEYSRTILVKGWISESVSLEPGSVLCVCVSVSPPLSPSLSHRHKGIRMRIKVGMQDTW
jgi:hypothetical protein